MHMALRILVLLRSSLRKESKQKKGKGKGDRNSKIWTQVIKEGKEGGTRSVEEDRSSDIKG